jgi:hypothetical protein
MAWSRRSHFGRSSCATWGVVHVVPNGAITTLANMTKGWSGYLIDVGVAYKEDRS